MPPLIRNVGRPSGFQALLDAARTARGPAAWRALDQLGRHPAFEGWLQREHPRLATAAAMNRRDFLRYAAASMALCGAAGCSRPPEEDILPMRVEPENLGQDDPRFYATALEVDGAATGVLVESHAGRPTKIEGNPAHPASLGGTDVFLQAAVLDIWDPDRSQAVLHQGTVSTWSQCVTALTDAVESTRGGEGEGLRLLTGAIGSPTLLAQIADLRRRHPRLRHHVWQSWPRDNVHAGTRAFFGQPMEPVPRLDRAAVIVALDADPLGRDHGRVRHARDFADGRRGDAGLRTTMNRLYVAEPSETITGAMADHRLAVGARQIGGLLRAIAAKIDAPDSAPAKADSPVDRWIAAAARDLATHRGTALILVGEGQPPELHAMAAAINRRLGGEGHCVDYRAAALEMSAVDSLSALADDLHAGRVRSLVLLDINPVYDAPPELRFAEAMTRVPHTLHLGLYADETALASRWHVPQAHALESWGDASAYDGTMSLVQPLMAPLYGGRTSSQVVAALAGEPEAKPYELVRAHWKREWGDDFGGRWDQSLRSGTIDFPLPRAQERPATGAATTPPAAHGRGEGIAGAESVGAESAGVESADALELVFRPDPTLRDGRYANNGWLQELPKPGTQLTWGNVVMIGPGLARDLALANGDEVRLRLHDREALGPIRVAATQAPRTVTVFLGGGRRHAGRVGEGVGFDAGALRARDTFWSGDGVVLAKTGRRIPLSSVQAQQRLDDTAPVRRLSMAALAGGVALPRPEALPSLYPERPRGDHAWGMTIDLGACIGCNVCTIACQAENNIPVVGAEQVRKGRVMHWIRVDRYEDEQARAMHQPVPCMHCEHAPCELVCPVGATVHDADGLNLQVYNRCIGTRFCANNCPYRVRRFNFLQFSDLETESLEGQRNPDVTVRNRGVMEKCTYCVQRIRAAGIAAQKENRPIRDGEVRTACQSACPTQAIRFGDLQDPDSAVSRAKASPLHYVLLEHHNTRPRTTYLARLDNPRPDFEAGT